MSLTLYSQNYHQVTTAMDGHLPSLGWSNTRRNCSKDLEFGTYTLLTKLAPGDLPSLGWSPINLRMVTNQKEVYSNSEFDTKT